MQHRIRIEVRAFAWALLFAAAASTAKAAEETRESTVPSTQSSVAEGAVEARADARESTDQTRLKDVVVTATRSAKSVEKIPGAISVITQEDLAPQLLIAEDPSQALATFVPGYAPSRQKLSNAGENLRGRRALILLDGIPQTNPLRDGRREGYFADPAIIERIEVVNGPSAIYGLGATGGIINYISKTPTKMGTEQRVAAKAITQFENDSLSWKAGYSLAQKNDLFDVLAYAGITKRGIAYDGDGRRIGMDAVQGDIMDSAATDAFLKAGTDFGQQRLQLSFNRFQIEGDGDYRSVPGNRNAGIPTTSEPGTPDGNPPRNKVQTASLDWRHADLGAGLASVQLYKQDFAALYGAIRSKSFQDPTLAPAGTLVDQSEIVADKWGVRTSWVRPDLFARGLELTLGLDYLRDVSEQRLVLTNRTLVPPTQFDNLAPFAQLEYELGRLTVRGGARREYARLNVDNYRTLAAYGNREVQGGTVDFAETVRNLGAIWRFGAGWSAFASYNEGFGLPDVGRALSRNSSGQSVENLIVLQPVLTDNQEVGLAWRGTRGSAGLSYYESSSDLGSTIRVVDGVSRLERLPVDIKGWELNGDWRFAKDWSLFGLYSQIRGKTAAAEGKPMDVELGASQQGPDKLVLGTNWAFAPRASARLQAARYFTRRINEGRRAGRANLEENFSGYTVADLALTYKASWGDLGLGVENLLDKQYIGYFPQSNPAPTDSNFFAGRGRTYTVSYARSF